MKTSIPVQKIPLNPDFTYSVVCDGKILQVKRSEASFWLKFSGWRKAILYPFLDEST